MERGRDFDGAHSSPGGVAPREASRASSCRTSFARPWADGAGTQWSDHGVHQVDGHEREQQLAGIPEREAVLARHLLALLVGQNVDGNAVKES